MSYSVPLQKRQVVIESCNADLRDVESATTVHTQSASYLLVRLKPAHTAACASGKRPAVALPTDDERSIAAVVAAINHSCCMVALGAPPAHAPVATHPPVATRTPLAPRTPAPTPTATPTPAASRAPNPAPVASVTSSPAAGASAAPSPRPSSSASPVSGRPVVQDWVENDGLFWFVRMRNRSHVAITPAGEVFDCRNVDVGCGPFLATQLDPGGIATVAVVATSSHDAAPSFDYRFTVSDGTDTVAGTGTSKKRAPRTNYRMTGPELRAAQGLAIGTFRAPHDSAAPVMPARLVKRGSSRLALGQSGTAIVRVTVAADGTPQDVSVVSLTNKQLAPAAIETAVSSTYTPAVQSGKPITAQYIATFSFTGEDPAMATIPVWKRPPSPTPLPTPSPASVPPAVPAGAASPAESVAHRRRPVRSPTHRRANRLRRCRRLRRRRNRSSEDGTFTRRVLRPRQPDECDRAQRVGPMHGPRSARSRPAASHPGVSAHWYVHGTG